MAIRRRGRIKVGSNKWYNIGSKGNITSFSSKSGGVTRTDNQYGSRLSRPIGKGISETYWRPAPKPTKVGPKFNSAARSRERRTAITHSGSSSDGDFFILVVGATALLFINVAVLALLVLPACVIFFGVREQQLASKYSNLFPAHDILEQIRKEILELYEAKERIDEQADAMDLRAFEGDQRWFDESNPKAKPLNNRLRKIYEGLVDSRGKLEALEKQLPVQSVLDQTYESLSRLNRRKKSLAGGLLTYIAVAGSLYLIQPVWLLSLWNWVKPFQFVSWWGTSASLTTVSIVAAVPALVVIWILERTDLNAPVSESDRLTKYRARIQAVMPDID